METNIVILCDKGKTGTLRQCEAVAFPMAKVLGAKVRHIPIQLPFWQCYLLPHITRWFPLTWFKPLKKFPPLPKTACVIAAGRQAILIAACVARHVPTITILNPKCPLSYFKYVITPRHDQLPPCNNLINIIGSLHPYSFNNEYKLTNVEVTTLAVLLGGDSRHHIYTKSDIKNICDYISELSQSYADEHKTDLHLSILGSRRTPKWALIQIAETFTAHPHFTLWPNPTLPDNQQPPNSYHNVLQHSCITLITGDSVSMISEACYFGKPTLIWDLGIKNKRFASFYNSILDNKHAIMIGTKHPDTTTHYSKWNTITTYSFTPLRETERVNTFLKNNFYPTLTTQQKDT